jgi:hypothetical protein
VSYEGKISNLIQCFIQRKDGKIYGMKEIKEYKNREGGEG